SKRRPGACSRQARPEGGKSASPLHYPTAAQHATDLDMSPTTSPTTFTGVILAAGQGTRMKSGVPKMMHTLAGRPLVYFPVRAALDAGCEEVVVVVGHGRDLVSRYLEAAFGSKVRTVVQETQKGTGDAARYGVAAVSSERVLVFYGDGPLVEGQDLTPVLRSSSPLAIATC